MGKELLDYFDSLEKYFMFLELADRSELEEIIMRAKKEGINLGNNYNINNPYSLFYCLGSDLGSCCIFDKDNNLIENIDYKERLYKLLEEYGYFYNNDIKLALRTFQKSLTKDKSMLAYTLTFKSGSGYKNVQNFESDGQYIHITDDSGYTYTVIDLNKYDMEKDEFNLSRIRSVIANGGDNDCHNYASQIAQLLPEGEMVTAACPRFVKGYYLHSYVQYGDYIIDLTMNIMMKKEDYYYMMGPVELSRTRNIDVSDKKTEIESLIGDLGTLGRRDWSYVLYIAFLNIKNNPEIMDSFNQNVSVSKKT